MGSSLVGFLLVFISGTAYCVDQGAVAGFSTSIPCNLGRQQDAPFWIINNTVYDLFSIARRLPFISAVTSYSSLTIPFIYLSIDNTVFQCALLNRNELELDTSIQLVVAPSGRMGITDDFRDIVVNELVLDYRQLYILENEVVLTWFAGPNCSHGQFQLQGYTLQSGRTVLSDSHVFNVSNANSLTIPLNTGNGMSINYRLVSLNQDGTCSENRDLYYYRFSDSKPLEQRVLNPNINSTVCYAIPRTTICTEGLRFVAGNHACPVQNSTAGHMVLQNCVRGYSDNMLKPELTESGEVCFSNVNPASVANGSLFHFLCSIDPCSGDQVCLLRSMISTYIVVYSGPPNEPIITYNGSFLCFSASYSHEEFPVENFAVQISDITGVSVDLAGTYRTRGPHCLSISSTPIPDLCLPFQISVSAVNVIGRSSTMAEFRPEIEDTELDLCSCYLGREQVVVKVAGITESHATLMLTCNRSNEAYPLNYVLENQDTQEEVDITVQCGDSFDGVRLSAVTDYRVFRRFGDTYCPVNNFTTSELAATSATTISTGATLNTVLGHSKGKAVQGSILPVITGTLILSAVTYILGAT